MIEFCSNKSAVNQVWTSSKTNGFLIPRYQEQGLWELTLAGAVDCDCGQCMSAVLVGQIEPESGAWPHGSSVPEFSQSQ